MASNDELHQGFGEQNGVSSVIAQATPHTLKPILEPEAGLLRTKTCQPGS